jgi:1-deoxy-D-xylulose-5-phosphate synthase
MLLLLLLQVGRGIVRRQGKDVCLLAYGSSVNEAMVAAELLSRAGVSATVVDARFCKPLDTDLIRRCAREHAAMISIEEGSIGGFAAHVMQFLALDGLLDGGLKFRPMTLPDRFIDHGRCVDVCNRVTEWCCIVHLATHRSLQLNSDVS